MNKCINCGKETKNNKFCNNECRLLYNKKVRTKKYYDNPNYCRFCNKVINNNGESFSETIKKVFCNSSCAASYNNKKFPKKVSTKRKIYCLWCGGLVKNGATKYCSSKCHQEYQYHIYINKWTLGIEDGSRSEGCSNQVRRFLHEKYNGECSRCGWNTPNPYNGIVYLEVEHIDVDRTNNKEKNLDLICPNCHSLTSTYKEMNRGNGKRKLRIKN